MMQLPRGGDGGGDGSAAAVEFECAPDRHGVYFGPACVDNPSCGDEMAFIPQPAVGCGALAAMPVADHAAQREVGRRRNRSCFYSQAGGW